jgi:hypothetical protein
MIETEGEIVFSEFTICSNTSNNQNKLITYLIPSIKYHRYSPDEIVSFNSDFLSSLTNEKNVYNFKYICNSNSLSYENINKKTILENNLNSILKDGKPFPEEYENKKSYNYFPKAIEIPSKKFQKKFEERIIYFIKQNFDDNHQKIFWKMKKMKKINVKIKIKKFIHMNQWYMKLIINY